MDDRVQTKLDFIQKASSAARDQAALYRRLGIDPAEVGGTPAEALRPAILSGVKYELQTCIQAMIDVAYHVSAKSFHAAPQDAYDAFERLVAGGALPRARLTVYRKMIGFRNLVVHGYETVDTGMVLAYADRTADFDTFRDEVQRFTRTAADDKRPTPEGNGPAGRAPRRPRGPAAH